MSELILFRNKIKVCFLRRIIFKKCILDFLTKTTFLNQFIILVKLKGNPTFLKPRSPDLVWINSNFLYQPHVAAAAPEKSSNWIQSDIFICSFCLQNRSFRSVSQNCQYVHSRTTVFPKNKWQSSFWLFQVYIASKKRSVSNIITSESNPKRWHWVPKI